MMKLKPHSPRLAGRLLLVLGLGLALGLLAPNNGSAATTPIYKCFDKNLGLLYTDEPCRDGELMNIRAGDADPAAVARLERARDALDLAASQRIADERRAAMERDLAAWYATQGPRGAYEDMAANTAYALSDYGAAWWMPGFTRARPSHPRPFKPLQSRRIALRSPQMAHLR